MEKVPKKIRYSVLLVFAFVFFRCPNICCGLKSNSRLICPEEKIILNGTEFEWKIDSTDNEVSYVISQPDVCWENDTIVLRQCDYDIGKWVPQQVQCKKYPRKNLKCPDDLIEFFLNDDEFLCLKISKTKEIFNEHFCYGSNFIIGHNAESIDNEVLNFISNEYQITSFWLPIKRYEDNKFNPFVIRLPGKLWNDLYYFREDPMTSASNQTLTNAEKHLCMVAYVQKSIGKQNRSTLRAQISHCGELHYSVCAIRKQFVAKTGCPQDFGALSHKPNECYGISWSDQKYLQDFRMLKAREYFEKINTINIIFEEFDIEDDKYVEIAGDFKIPESKWAIKPKNNRMKIASSIEKIHGLCVEYIAGRKNVEMILRMDSDLESLILTVYNKFYIWSNKKPVENNIHCFTNADYEKLSRVEVNKIWENNSQTKTIFKLKIKNDDPGQYWCEAHTIFNFSHVSSSKVIGFKTLKGHAFAVQIEVSSEYYDFTAVHTPYEMKRIANGIKKDMKAIVRSQRHLNDLVIHNVRIMDITYIDTKGSFLRCVCHVTVSLKSWSLDKTSEEDNLGFEDDEEFRRDTVVRIRAKNVLMKVMQEYQPNGLEFVRSTEFCFPENQWHLARIGQSATQAKLCLQSNGLPLTRKCLGDFIRGAYWEELKLEDCLAIAESNFVTINLYSIDRTNTSIEQLGKNVKDVRKLLETNLKMLIPADLYYLSKIIKSSIRTFLMAPFELSTGLLQSYTPQWNNTLGDYFASETFAEILRIFNSLLEINEDVLHPTVVLNSTNILLEAFENFMDHFSSLHSSINQNVSMENPKEDDKNKVEVREHLDIGVVVKMSRNVIAFVLNPQVANVSGVALYQAEPNNSQIVYHESLLKGSFENEYYQFILANQSAEELLNKPNILMATYVPITLLQRLDEIAMMSNGTLQTQRPEAKVVVKIYANNKLFQETNETLEKCAVGKVISISIPGHSKDLPEILPLILTLKANYNDSRTQEQSCSYWNYETWATDGIMFINRSEINNNTVLCGCTHLTPFAYLIGGSYSLSVDSDIQVVVKKNHKKALDIITLLGCSLSLFGIVGIFATACTFPSWCRKANSKVLLQFSAAIALQMILFCFVNTEENSLFLISSQIFTSCIAIGACLHYSVLVQFCWMVIIAYLQFKRYVQVFGNTRPKRFFIKSIILGWGLPLVPVACVLAFDSDSYIPHKDNSSNPLCYPSGISFYLGIVMPITLAIIANLIIFIIVLFNILKNPGGNIRRTEKSLILSQIRLLVLLFFLLGFTWIFGLLNAMKAGYIFSYLFCLTATLQGFVLFIYFIVLDPVTRRMWSQHFAKLCHLKPKIENSSSGKESTQSF